MQSKCLSLPVNQNSPFSFLAIPYAFLHAGKCTKSLLSDASLNVDKILSTWARSPFPDENRADSH